MHDRERPSFEDSNNVTVKRCFFAYEFAAEIVKDKVCADIGCADGYGTQYLADYAAQITGVDYSTDTIRIASSKYPQKKNLFFKQSSVPPLPFQDHSLDVVTAFQFIEHIHARKSFMQEVKRVLKPGGVFLCSTPNRLMSIARNPFHVFEYSFDEMRGEALDVFSSIELKGVQGSSRVNSYYEANAQWAKKILRLDPLGIHKLIPSAWLTVPYNWITSVMRKELKESQKDTLAITTADFHLTETNLNHTWDIFLIAYS